MHIETPPTEKRYDRPEGERRGLVIGHAGDGKGKRRRNLFSVVLTSGYVCLKQ